MHATSLGRPWTLTERLTSPGSPDFALLYRPATWRGRVELLVGETSAVTELSDLPLTAPPEPGCGPARHDILALIPYREITERGFEAVDDGIPLLAMRICEQHAMRADDVIAELPDEPVTLAAAGFDIQDDDYSDIVERVIKSEIGRGAGSNFVIKRSFLATIINYSGVTALSIFRRLLAQETGAYWTFLIKTGDRTLIGATPERHVSVRDNVVTMTPISGTYRYPAGGPTLDGLLAFMADGKEADELYMVLDEELKMMARICDRGGRVSGPFLKEMANLAHTEYAIEGRTRLDFRQILRETMFAPPVVGSPLENACRVVTRYEQTGRAYYSGVLALAGHDGDGHPELDSAIAIRTADISAGGQLRIDVGATLVRHSDPAAEGAETMAKAAGLLTAIGDGTPPGPAAGRPGQRPAAPGRLARDFAVRSALRRRNAGLSRFWLDALQDNDVQVAELRGRRALVIDGEDTFTAMLGHQLRALGLDVTILPYGDVPPRPVSDLVVMGPGPGDPTDLADAKMRALREIGSDLLARRVPLLGLCLGHQIIADLAGLMVRRRATPNQGVQRDIMLSGSLYRVGFYNTFAAYTDLAETRCPGIGRVRVTRDEVTDEVHVLRGPHFSSFQFHPESVLSEDGISILGREVTGLVFPECRGGVCRMAAEAR